MRVIFVCHGNICRSTMAESYMNHIVREAGLQNRIQVESRATSREEIGNPPHPGTVRELKKHHIPVTPHRATRMTDKDYESADLIVYMDANNKRNLMRMFDNDPEHKMRPLLDRGGSLVHRQLRRYVRGRVARVRRPSRRDPRGALKPFASAGRLVQSKELNICGRRFRAERTNREPGETPGQQPLLYAGRRGEPLGNREGAARGRRTPPALPRSQETCRGPRDREALRCMDA
jgi:protein-tyrosine phosphatase